MGGSLRHRTVLVVEDEYPIARYYRRLLEKHGAVVVGPASHLKAAMQLVMDAAHLDVALVDVNLAGELAFPVADALRARGVPLVFMTGYAREPELQRYVDTPLITKPADPAEVLAALSAAVTRRSARAG